jgi:elongation factor G
VSNSIERIRTIALVGQSGSGKTSLVEALLAKAGAIPAGGSVERGTTACDYTPLEKQLQHSLKLAVASFETKDTRIHLLDTPGYPDFLGNALPALAAVETAGIVINAQNGIEMMTGSSASSRPSARNACRSTCRPATAARFPTASSRHRAKPTSRRWKKRTGASWTRWSRSTRS